VWNRGLAHRSPPFRLEFPPPDARSDFPQNRILPMGRVPFLCRQPLYRSLSKDKIFPPPQKRASPFGPPGSVFYATRPLPRNSFFPDGNRNLSPPLRPHQGLTTPPPEQAYTCLGKCLRKAGLDEEGSPFFFSMVPANDSFFEKKKISCPLSKGRESKPST